jgi:predicted metal-dependent phosphoesterase TrpH
VCILAHPFRKKHPLDKIVAIKNLTAIEVYNGKNSEYEIYKSDALRRIKNLKAVGGSDAHRPFEVGKCYTEFSMHIKTVVDLVHELKSGNYWARQTK